MKKTHFIFFIVIVACNSKQLTIRDLKFGDFEKEAIAKNKVDTTYLVGKNPLVKGEFGELINLMGEDTSLIFNWKFMDVGFVAFDSLGNVIADRSHRFLSYRYFYDSLGILDSIVYRDWDVALKYNSSYHFYPDSLLLVQEWNERGKLRHIYRFRFNNDGQVIEKYDNDDENHFAKRDAYRTFEYENGKLTFRRERIYEEGQLESETITRLYYSKNSRLDSTVSNVNDKRRGKNKLVTYYDTNGLKTRTVLQDTVTIMYRHLKMNR